MFLPTYQKFLEKFSANSSKYLLSGYAFINLILITLIFSCLIYISRQKARLDNISRNLYNEQINISRYRDISINLARNVAYYKSFKTAEIPNDSILINDIGKSLLAISEIKSSQSISRIHFSEHIDALIADYSNLSKENDLLLQYLTQLGDEGSGIYYKMLNSVKDFMNKYQASQEQAQSLKGIEPILYSIQLLNKVREEAIIQDIQNRFIQISDQLNVLAPDSNNYLIIRVSDALQNVRFSFQEYARKCFEIGINQDKGLLQKITERYNKIEFRLAEAQIIVNEVKFQRNFSAIMLLIILLLVFLLLNISAIFLFINREKKIAGLFEDYITKLAEGKAISFKQAKYPLDISPLIDKLEDFSLKFQNAKMSMAAFTKGNFQLAIEKEKHFPHFHSLFMQLRELNEQIQKNVAEEIGIREKMVWTKNGIDKLTEVMRRQYDNPLMHANEIINMLVEYLHIPIGAIYLVKIENEIKFIEMVSAFAYGKEKQMYRKILFGEGIIGTAASERKTLNITNIPENYFNIVSGFGESKPKNIIACPIKLNEDLYGVIELSSLSRFKEEEVNFIEEVCKTIAFSFAISKVYLDTLSQFENSHLQIAELEAENESLMNDYKDLNSNFKQLASVSSENEFIITRLNDLIYRASLDLDANVVESNLKFNQLFKSDRKKLIHSNYREYMTGMKFLVDNDFDYIWRDVRAGIHQDFESGIEIGNEEIWLKQYLFPVKDDIGRVIKIHLAAFDITYQVKLKKEYDALKTG